MRLFYNLVLIAIWFTTYRTNSWSYWTKVPENNLGIMAIDKKIWTALEPQCTKNDLEENGKKTAHKLWLFVF